VTVLQIGITVACLLGSLWLLVLIARDRRPERWFLTAMAVLELLMVVHLVLGVVRLTGDAADGVADWEYVGYLVGALLVIPAGVIWSSGEPSRGGTAVLLVALLVVPFLFVRLADIWAAGG
jgi:hypothetical protein